MRLTSAQRQTVLALSRAILLTAMYGGWVIAFRLLFLTLVTYIFISASAPLREISEVFSSHEILLAGSGAFLFAWFLHRVWEWRSFTFKELWSWMREMGPESAKGVFFGLALVVAFLLAGYYEYLGSVIAPDEPPSTVLSVLLRCLALASMILFEEYFFRGRVLPDLSKHLLPHHAAVVTSLLYCSVKALQFGLGIMHLTTLFLASTFLGLRALEQKTFLPGAGFWMGLLLLIHPLLGLPILGNDFAGLFLLQYKASARPGLGLFLTGGIGGPLSSFALQVLLLLLTTLLFWRAKKKLLNPISDSL